MFGISFGANKTKSKSSFDKTETGTQATTGNNTTTSTGSSSSTGTSNTSSSGTNQQSTTNKGTQTTTGQTQGFSDTILDSMDSGIGRLIGQFFESGASGGTAMGALGDFDSEAFVESTLRAARETQGTKLGEGIRGIVGLLGGNTKENSASALLANRMENETAANLAGVAASAQAKAAEIEQSRASTISGIQSTEGNMLAQVLNAMKGGLSKTSQATEDNSVQQQAGSTTQQGVTTTSEQSTQMQQVAEVINQIINSQTHAKGTGTESGTKIGGGVSAGI